MKPQTRHNLDELMKRPDVNFDGYEPWILGIMDLQTKKIYKPEMGPALIRAGRRIRYGRMYLYSGVFQPDPKRKEKIVI